MAAERAELLRHVEQLLGDELTASDDEDVAIAELEATIEQLVPPDDDNGEKEEQDSKIRAKNEEDQDLFALQVFIESVEVECEADLEDLAVAFRLMDFPTVMIERSSEEEEESSFQAGKSCLFRLDYREAISYLQTAPLYLMLIDKESSRRTGILVGSTSVDLSGLIGFKDTGKEGFVLPAMESQWGWRRGDFPSYDLMGNRVARILTRIRLCNFGDGILPHIGRPEYDQAPPIEEEDILAHKKLPADSLPVRADLLNVISKMDRRLEEIEKMQKIALRKPKKERRLRADLRESDAKSKTEVSNSSWLPKPGQDEGVCLPPPMYFSHRKEVRKDENEGLNLRDEENDTEFDSESTNDVLEELMIRELNLQHEENGEKDVKAENFDIIDIKKEEPIINCREIREVASQENMRESEPTQTRKKHVLKIRKTRAQVMRERANKRKFSTRTGLGMLTIGTDLAKSRMLAERDMQERRWLLERRKEADNDTGKMRLNALIESADAALDKDAATARIREEQLSLMLRGNLSPQNAYGAISQPPSASIRSSPTSMTRRQRQRYGHSSFSFGSVDHFVMLPPPADDELSSSRYQSFDSAAR